MYSYVLLSGSHLFLLRINIFAKYLWALAAYIYLYITLFNATDVISPFLIASVTFGSFLAGMYPIGLHIPSKAFTTMAFSSRLLTQFDPQILISDVYDGKIKYERTSRVFVVEIRKYHQKILLHRYYIFRNIRKILLFLAQFQANFLP